MEVQISFSFTKKSFCVNFFSIHVACAESRFGKLAY